MNRKILIASTITLALIGVLLTSVPFTGSLQPSEKAKSARPQFDISNLGNGEYQFKKPDSDERWNSKFLIIRDWDGEVYVNLVPVENGKVFMPDRFWRWTGHHCSDLRPETGDDNKILPSGEILCHDSDMPEWSKEKWRWTYDGRSKTDWVADMFKPQFEFRSNVVYVCGRSC